VWFEPVGLNETFVLFGQMRQLCDLSWLAQMRQLCELSQSGQRRHLCYVSQLGQISNFCDLSQLGQMRQLCELSQLGQRRHLCYVSQLGLISHFCDLSQLGQMRQLCDLSQLREMSNLVEFTWPWTSSTLGVSEFIRWRVKKRDVSESVMFLIRMLRRVRKNHGHVRRIKGSQDSDILNGTRF